MNKCSGSSGSSVSNGINIDPCSISNEKEDDVIEIHLTFQPGNEYNLAGIFEWEEEDDDSAETIDTEAEAGHVAGPSFDSARSSDASRE